MEDRRTKIKFYLLVVLAWLLAIALAYIAIIKIKLLSGG